MDTNLTKPLTTVLGTRRERGAGRERDKEREGREKEGREKEGREGETKRGTERGEMNEG